MSVSTELTGAFYILWPPIFDTRNGFPNEQSIFVDYSLGTRASIKLSRKHKDTLILIWTRYLPAVRGFLIRTKLSLCDYFYMCKSYVTMNHPRKTACTLVIIYDASVSMTHCCNHHDTPSRDICAMTSLWRHRSFVTNWLSLFWSKKVKI